MVKKYMKRCSTLLIIRKVPIKITMRYHLTPARMASIKKATNNKFWRGCGGKGTLLYYWWECELVQPWWKTVWRFLKKQKINLPYYPVIQLLGIHLNKTFIQKDTFTVVFTAALFTTAMTWKQTKCSLTDEWIKKMLYLSYPQWNTTQP